MNHKDDPTPKTEKPETDFTPPDEVAARDDAEPETTEPEDNDVIEPTGEAPVVPARESKWRRVWRKITTHKAVMIPLIIVIILGLLAAVPWTRYKIAALFWKQTVTIAVIDSETRQPVSSAAVTIAGTTVQTDNQGHARLKIAVGSKQVTIAKKYYRTTTQSTFVPILKPKHDQQINLVATGRQVQIQVTNKITKAGLADATIKAADAEFKTDKDGKATAVLPADKQTVAATLSASGYNTSEVTIQVSGQTLLPANSFTMTPSGKVYFLSNLTGKIDVVKTNLDGTDRATVIAGTGSEERQNTVLLASRDWKYLAFLSKRDKNEAKLYLIDTSTDKMTAMDEGTARFTPVGWQDHTFVYKVERTNVKAWEANREALKSFEAQTAKLNTLDQTQASGTQVTYQYETFNNIYLLDNQVVYNTQSYGVGGATGQTVFIRGVQPNGQGKKDYKSLPGNSYLNAVPYEFGSIYFSTYIDNATKYLEFEDNAVKDVDKSAGDAAFAQGYPTYLQSPTGKSTFWADLRDGKNTLFVGDAEAKNQKQIAALSEYTSYGWYSDSYLLVAKNGSELGILPVAGGDVLKVSDYFKPTSSFRGYGGGYGGL